MTTIKRKKLQSVWLRREALNRPFEDNAPTAPAEPAVPRLLDRHQICAWQLKGDA